MAHKLKSAQFDVREFFQARYETDHHEIVAEVDDVNSLLKDIGSEELTKSWSATVTITATVTGIEAPNAEAAQEIIENASDEPLDEAKKIISKYKDKLKKYRTCGLESGGEYSDENLVFKILRRNNYIQKLFDSPLVAGLWWVG